MPQKYVTLDSVATFVHHRGPTTLPGTPPDLSRGAPIVCIHGAGDNGNSFGPLLDALAAKHSPISFDFPAHGRSGGLDSLGDIAVMAAHTKALVDQLGITNPVLVGDGMGAAVAVEAAAANPGWARALVLTSVSEPPSDEAVTAVRRIATGKARREFDRTGYAPETAKEVYQQAFADWVKTDPRATLGDLEAMQRWQAKPVSCPVMIVTGEHEDNVGSLKGTRHVTLPGAGRHGIIEQPAALAQLIEEFLA